MSTVVSPFVYPVSVLVRRHAPSGYDDYRKFKPWLRDEFAFRCVYCLSREMWYPDRASSFAVEHVFAKSKHPHLETDYSNLVYACTNCNTQKGTKQLPLDPTADAFGQIFTVGPNGTITASTLAGEIFLEHMLLNESPAIDVRREKLQLIRAKIASPLCPHLDSVYRQHFGYPMDMPDLKSLIKHSPTITNANSGSEDGSYFERNRKGEVSGPY